MTSASGMPPTRQGPRRHRRHRHRRTECPPSRPRRRPLAVAATRPRRRHRLSETGRRKARGLRRAVHRAGSACSFEMAGETWSGKESDGALADAVAAAGNVILPADATFEGLVDASANQRRRPPAACRAARVPPSAPLRATTSAHAAVSRLWLRRLVASATTCSCSTPMVRYAGCCPSCASAIDSSRRCRWPRCWR